MLSATAGAAHAPRRPCGAPGSRDGAVHEPFTAPWQDSPVTAVADQAQQPGRRGLRLAAALLLALAVAATGPAAAAGKRPGDDAEAHVKVQLEGVGERVGLVPAPGGGVLFELHPHTGPPTRLTPEAFAARVFDEQRRWRWWNRLLNITSPIGIAWVALGLLGQLLFTGRMLLQWLASERSKASVVPPAFWWLSLVGATMLLVYFVWRRDVVGVLGQLAGWVIYLRNLWLIYRGGGAALSGPASSAAEGAEAAR